MSNRGGQRIGAGRKPGSLSKTTKEQQATLRELAQTYSEDAIISLHMIAKEGNSESARVSAAVAILDRAYGKPVQIVDTANDAETSTKRTTLTDIELARGIAWLLRKGVKAQEKLAKDKVIEINDYSHIND